LGLKWARQKGVGLSGDKEFKASSEEGMSDYSLVRGDIKCTGLPDYKGNSTIQ
jgi:hypothetical protein